MTPAERLVDFNQERDQRIRGVRAHRPTLALIRNDEAPVRTRRFTADETKEEKDEIDDAYWGADQQTRREIAAAVRRLTAR
jgi:hypothetical protein